MQVQDRRRGGIQKHCGAAPSLTFERTIQSVLVTRGCT